MHPVAGKACAAPSSPDMPSILHADYERRFQAVVARIKSAWRLTQPYQERRNVNPLKSGCVEQQSHFFILTVLNNKRSGAK
jgi:hypothetical protein